MQLKNKTFLKWGAACIILGLVLSCESLVETSMPSNIYVERQQVFEDPSTTLAAVNGLYAQLIASSSAYNGGAYGIASLTGLNADILAYTSQEDLELLQFEQNNLQADNSLVAGVWNSLYQIIYNANTLMEGVEASESLPQELVSQYTGEGLVVRAMAHFYLVNLFGDVPLVTSSDYRNNATIPRTATQEVYQQIVVDLKEARTKLSENYPDNGERTRINKAVATALLARVFAYTQQWEQAADMASELIADSQYHLVGLDSISLANNAEAIWQLHPSRGQTNAVTAEGSLFNNYPEQYYGLTATLVDGFAAGDLRREQWVLQHSSGLFIPQKYKVAASGGTREERSVVFRLAEQYLIRAEAKIALGELSEAIADLDVIRERAGLPSLLTVSSSWDAQALMQELRQNDKAEFFTEWGHRWFDLKRWSIAQSVLSAKSGFTATDRLWPLPQSELDNNPALRGHQNPGY
ncbi:RagB/SusD family nutrient uptake outer membrane protein [Zhouia sp. PK063]|uniref:RagB/SusD family nutrient uptake outer membrane protein n=1 Tax=Zhouia sp. PK063 TaxID=3373602 RepID=UPI0037B002A5